MDAMRPHVTDFQYPTRQKFILGVQVPFDRSAEPSYPGPTHSGLVFELHGGRKDMARWILGNSHYGRRVYPERREPEVAGTGRNYSRRNRPRIIQTCSRHAGGGGAVEGATVIERRRTVSRLARHRNTPHHHARPVGCSTSAARQTRCGAQNCPRGRLSVCNRARALVNACRNEHRCNCWALLSRQSSLPRRLDW